MCTNSRKKAKKIKIFLKNALRLLKGLSDQAYGGNYSVHSKLQKVKLLIRLI